MSSFIMFGICASLFFLCCAMLQPGLAYRTPDLEKINSVLEHELDFLAHPVHAPRFTRTGVHAKEEGDATVGKAVDSNPAPNEDTNPRGALHTDGQSQNQPKNTVDPPAPASDKTGTPLDAEALVDDAKKKAEKAGYDLTAQQQSELDAVKQRDIKELHDDTEDPQHGISSADNCEKEMGSYIAAVETNFEAGGTTKMNADTREDMIKWIKCCKRVTNVGEKPVDGVPSCQLPPYVNAEEGQNAAPSTEAAATAAAAAAAAGGSKATQPETTTTNKCASERTTYDTAVNNVITMSAKKPASPATQTTPESADDKTKKEGAAAGGNTAASDPDEAAAKLVDAFGAEGGDLAKFAQCCGGGAHTTGPCDMKGEPAKSIKFKRTHGSLRKKEWRKDGEHHWGGKSEVFNDPRGEEPPWDRDEGD
jgi:hypothetical protein